MAARNTRRAQYIHETTDPRHLEYRDRMIEGLRKSGMSKE